MVNPIANQNLTPSQVLGRTNECMRRLFDAGLVFDALQVPIDDPRARERLVKFVNEGCPMWKRPPFPTIDCDGAPYIPDGWSIEEHQKSGQFELDPTKIKLYLSEAQRKGDKISGNELRKELEGKLILNAYVLDYLLTHPELIPEDWKRDDEGRIRCIFFWGTIYRDLNCALWVRCLCWGGDRWSWRCYWLDDRWDVQHSAALRVS